MKNVRHFTSVTPLVGFAEMVRSKSAKVRAPLRRWVKWSLVVVAALLAALLLFIASGLVIAWRPLGHMAEGARLERMQQSSRWKGDRFHDTLPRIEPDILEILPKWFSEPQPNRRPVGPLAHLAIGSSAFERPPKSGTRITWLGHSTLIVEMGGKRILVDPVWGEYVAPLELKNARRFIPPPLPFEQLPQIDAVVISHDHYDHLDYPTIVRLAAQDVPFFVPLGIGAHLEYWGVSRARIHEHDWWEEAKLGSITLACTPARHFSGRMLVDKDRTLWAGWAFIGPQSRLFYSGDTALHPEFVEIGRRYGPFDATMMESGAYNGMWADVHLGPEQAVIAHKMLGGGLLIPVHWGMFDLGLHGWTEPVERILVAAEKAGVKVVTLKPGQSVEPSAPPAMDRWWPKHPWQTVEEAPAFSSGMGDLSAW